MRKKWLLDSFALLTYLKKEKNYQKVHDILSSGDEIVMNEINIGEVYYIISRNRSPTDAEYFLSNIAPLLPIRTVSPSFPLVIDAARIKSGYPISFADAFAAATAIKEGATVVTGDREFKSLQKIVTIEWI